MKFKLDGFYGGKLVTLNDKHLTATKSQKMINHSPDGFNWGYGGSGPAQLALAICLELLPPEQARNNYQQFKWDIIAQLPKSDFSKEIEYFFK